MRRAWTRKMTQTHAIDFRAVLVGTILSKVAVALCKYLKTSPQSLILFQMSPFCLPFSFYYIYLMFLLIFLNLL